MADLSAYLKNCSLAANYPTCTEWNTFIQAVQDAINNAVRDQIPALVLLSDGATIAVDWSLGNVQRVIVASNRTFTFANAVSGQPCALIVVQDGSGGHTSQTFPASMRFTGASTTQPTTTANKSTFYDMIYNDADGKYGVLTVSLNH